MSFLERQQKAFAADLGSAASKLNGATKRRAPSPTPSVTSIASPAPTAAAAAGSQPANKKSKRDNTATIYSQPANTGFGAELGSNIIYIVDYLKGHGKPKTLAEILDHMSLNKRDDAYKKTVRDALLAHTKVKYVADPKAAAAGDPADAWKTGRYEHLPVIPGVKDETSLLRYLQDRNTAQGVSVKDLKDGWADCDEAISRLERAHKLLVVRTKKDNVARSVWIDDPSLFHDVDPDFKTMWHRVEVPAPADIVRKLTQVGQKPTSEDPRLKVQAVSKEKKQKKRTARIGKMTNTHMMDLLKDYSHIKK